MSTNQLDKKSQAWSALFSEPMSELVQRYTASVGFDRRLWKADIAGSLAHAEMLAALAFCVGVPLASAWMGALYAQGPAYVFNVPVRPTVDSGLVAVFGMMTALSAFAGAAISAAGLLRASVAQGLRS